jgi:hypothetical protein
MDVLVLWVGMGDSVFRGWGGVESMKNLLI